MEENNPEQSKYNEAMFQIQRLHDSWMKCNSFARVGKFNDWQWELDIIWRELCSDVAKCDDSKSTLDENDRLKRDISNAKPDRTNWYNALDARHQFLKKLQNEVGKGGVYYDGTEEDFD